MHRFGYGDGFWSKAGRRRQVFAERLARELVSPAPGALPGPLNDFVVGSIVRTSWASAPAVAPVAFAGAPELLKRGGVYGIIGRDCGDVMYVHGDPKAVWSLVVPYRPAGTPILLCLDDLTDRCLAFFGDGPEEIGAIAKLHTDVNRAMADRRHSWD